MTDDHSNWVEQRDLELITTRGHFVFLDVKALEKVNPDALDRSRSIAGSGSTLINPFEVQRWIDKDTITLRPAYDAVWHYVGGYDNFMQKHGLKPKA